MVIKDKLPNDEIEIIDDGEEVVAGDIPDGSEKSKEKVDDTTEKEELSKKEEEANLRIKRIEDSNKKLMEIFTSPEFFSKLGSSMKQPPAAKVVVEPTAEQVQVEKQKLEDMDRQQFQTHILAQVSETVKTGVKPEIDKLATQMSTFISGQAENTAEGRVADFIKDVGRSEFDKHAAAMEAKANTTRGLSMPELYELVSGKKASVTQNVIPNLTHKPGEGTKELTEQKDLSLNDAGARNFDHIFGKYKK